MSDSGSEWWRVFCVFLGGGVGSLARYGVGRGFAIEAFPWHTFFINILGSFLLGVLVMSLRERVTLLLLLGTGLCGGFTTFSTFSVETVVLLQNGKTVAALGYSMGTVGLGFLAAMVAMRCVG